MTRLNINHLCELSNKARPCDDFWRVLWCYEAAWIWGHSKDICTLVFVHRCHEDVRSKFLCSWTSDDSLDRNESLGQFCASLVLFSRNHRRNHRFRHNFSGWRIFWNRRILGFQEENCIHELNDVAKIRDLHRSSCSGDSDTGPE